MMRQLSALICGILFGLGLAVSGMTDTQKVIGFLDILGNWKPDLMFVMGAALVVTVIGYRLALNTGSPKLDNIFYLPTSTVIDKKLLVGAVLFGIGWGFYGYCPGPAIASIAYLNIDTILFVIAMISGMLAQHLMESFTKEGGLN